MKRLTADQHQLLKRLTLAGCPLDAPVVPAPCPFRITYRTTPHGLSFPTTAGTGVVVDLQIYAGDQTTGNVYVTGYEITLNRGTHRAKPVDLCPQHGKFCLHQKDKPHSYDRWNTLNFQVGGRGLVNCDKRIEGFLLAEFPSTAELDPEVEHDARLWVRDHRRAEYSIRFRLISSVLFERRRAASKRLPEVPGDHVCPEAGTNTLDAHASCSLVAQRDHGINAASSPCRQIAGD